MESFPRGKTKVLVVSKSEAEVPKGLGYLLFIVSKGEGIGSSIIVT